MFYQMFFTCQSHGYMIRSKVQFIVTTLPYAYLNGPHQISKGKDIMMQWLLEADQPVCVNITRSTLWCDMFYAFMSVYVTKHITNSNMFTHVFKDNTGVVCSQKSSLPAIIGIIGLKNYIKGTKIQF